MSTYEERRDRDQRERREAFGDAVYAAWRAGMNSDNVRQDDIDEGYYRSYDRSEAAQYAVDALRSRSRRNEDPSHD